MPLTCSMETLSQSMHDGYTGPGFIPSVKLQFSVSELPYTKEFENIKSKLRCSEHQGESTFCWVDTSQNGAPHYPMCTQDLQEWARCCQQQGNFNWRSFSILRVPSVPPADPEFADADELRKRIIAALKDDSQDSVDAYIVGIQMRFSNVSEADCDYVMRAVASQDKLVRKSMELAIDSLPVNKQWGLNLSVRMAAFLNLQGPAGVVPLWCIDIASSEEEEELMSKFRRITERCKDLLMVTIIDVRESVPYKQPEDSSDTEFSVEGRDLLTFREWRSDSDQPALGSIMSSIPHRWVNPLKITVKTWLRHPEGQFSFDVKPSDNQYYAYSQICPYPTMDNRHLDSVLKRGMTLIRESLAGYVEKYCKPVEDLSAIRKWTPPARVFDWDSMMNHVRTASLRDGYDRYCEWHVTLKCKASDSDIAEQGFQSNEPNKRLRRA
ncbi:hypothetical protein EDD22DRAFT_851777 [Suillus occidentalis]|nr:hypothetical protein EDD22DRAFT_851777 [Suillus occidentalis]